MIEQIEYVGKRVKQWRRLRKHKYAVSAILGYQKLIQLAVVIHIDQRAENQWYKEAREFIGEVSDYYDKVVKEVKLAKRPNVSSTGDNGVRE